MRAFCAWTVCQLASAFRNSRSRLLRQGGHLRVAHHSRSRAASRAASPTAAATARRLSRNEQIFGHFAACQHGASLPHPFDPGQLQVGEAVEAVIFLRRCRPVVRSHALAHVFDELGLAPLLDEEAGQRIALRIERQDVAADIPSSGTCG